MFALILSLVFLSGLTGLIYQVTWQKYLSIFLGSHAFATALVLGVFFLFLSIGYFAAGRYSSRLIKNKLLLYGVVEFFIGAYALISPNIFYLLNDVLSIHTKSEFTTVTLGLTFASLFIGLPTFLMGATIPVLTLGLSKSALESHRTHALIYGVNTIGAFVGCLLAGFWMIESFGLPLTLMYTGLLNIAIFVATAAIVRQQPEAFSGGNSEAFDKATTTQTQDLISSNQKIIAYVISFLSGFYVFTLENILIRIAGFSIGSSTYTFTIIVSAFIFSIGIGSVLVAKIQKQTPVMILFASQILLLFAGLATYHILPYWPEIFLRVRVLIQPSHMNFYFYWAMMFLLFMIVLVPFVIFMGMNLPLLFGQLRYSGSLNKITGRLYGINCMGSFLGALIGGYLLFNYFEADTIMKFALALILLSSILLLFLNNLNNVTFGFRGKLVSVAAICSFIIVSFFIVKTKSWSRYQFTPASYFYFTSQNKYFSYSDFLESIKKSKRAKILASFTDPNTFVDITDTDGERSLYLNGKPDTASKTDARTRALAALIPISIAPFTVENVFISGLGAGLSTAIATNFNEVKNVDVAEISSGVIKSLKYFSEFNHNLENRTQKFKIHQGDAYKILKDSDKKYDVMISEPTHLWVSGVEKLYSYDFYQLAATKLRPDGFYVQWIPAFNLDPETFLTLLKGFNLAFKYSTLWSTTGTALALIGTNAPMTLSVERLTSRFKEQKEIYDSVGFHHPLTILTAQIMSPLSLNSLAMTAKENLHTLENPLLEYQAGRTFFATTSTNLDDLVLPLNRVATYYDMPDNQPLIKLLPLNQIPTSALIDGSQWAKDGFKIHKDFVNYLLLQKDPEIFKFDDTTKIFMAGLGFKKTNTLVDMSDEKSIQQLARAMTIFYNSFTPMNFSYIHELFLFGCKKPLTADACTKNKLLLIASVGRPKFIKMAEEYLQKKNFSIDRKPIDDLFSTAFRQAGALRPGR